MSLGAGGDRTGSGTANEWEGRGFGSSLTALCLIIPRLYCLSRTSRFDLIYLVLDKVEEERDRRLARHLVSLFHAEEPSRPQQQVWPICVGEAM